MNEFTITDTAGQEVQGTVTLGTLDSGKAHTITLTATNNLRTLSGGETSYPITLNIRALGDKDIQLLTPKLTIPADGQAEIILEATPTTIRLKPIQFTLEIDYEYTVT